MMTMCVCERERDLCVCVWVWGWEVYVWMRVHIHMCVLYAFININLSFFIYSVHSIFSIPHYSYLNPHPSLLFPNLSLLVTLPPSSYLSPPPPSLLTGADKTKVTQFTQLLRSRPRGDKTLEASIILSSFIRTRWALGRGSCCSSCPKRGIKCSLSLSCSFWTCLRGGLPTGWSEWKGIRF